jgi:hypothetical protein
MYWVTPGRYYVNASPSRGPDFGAPTSNEVIDQGYATTYYPGTMDASLAATIEVHQKPVRGIQAVLIPDRRERRDHYKTSTSDQNGHFTFRGLTPGDYQTFCLGASGTVRLQRSGGPATVRAPGKSHKDLRIH